MCELQAQVQLRTSTVFHFEYRFRHSDIVLDKARQLQIQDMNDFDPSIKKGQVD